MKNLTNKTDCTHTPINNLVTEQDLINAGANLRSVDRNYKLYDIGNQCYSVYEKKVVASWTEKLKQYRETKKISLISEGVKKR